MRRRLRARRWRRASDAALAARQQPRGVPPDANCFRVALVLASLVQGLHIVSVYVTNHHL